MKTMIVAIIAALMLVSSAFANVVGLSTHPFQLEKHVIGTEVTSNLSAGSGFGVQARYMHRLAPELNLDAGAMMAGGERNSRFFAGADYMIFPDYDSQPRVSIKSFLERTSEFDRDKNNIGFAPVVSKGFSFWGNEAFPFVAIPIKLSLDSDSSTYETVSSLAFGITGRLPIEGYTKLVGNIEANIDIENSYTGLVMGIGYPL